MDIHKRLNTTIQEQRRMDRLSAENEKLKALIDYIAMMADVEIPTEEEEEVSHEF